MCFLLWELSVTFYIVHRHRVCLADRVDLICSGFNLQLVQLVGRFWAFFLSHTAPWVSIVVLFPPLHVDHPLGFAPEAALEDLGLPL